MRKILATTFAITLATTALMASAQVRWLKPTHDFGAFNEDLGAVDAVFQFVNDGDQPVRVLDARATCGCTRPQVPSEAIAPGDTGEIKVTYLAQGRPGRFSKNIYVRTSDNPTEQRTLVVKGTVIGASATLASRFPVTAGPLKMRTATVGFGDVTRGKLKTQFVELYNQSADTVYPAVSGVPDYIQVNITPAAVPPGEQAQIAFTLQTLNVPDWGISGGKFAFTPNPGEEPVEMDYFTIVSEDFSRMTPGERLNAPVAALSPERINLGEVGVDEPLHAEFTVSNSGKSTLIIRRMQVVDTSVTSATISSEKIKPGKKATIKLSIDPAKAENDFINIRLTLITNDPDNSVITGRVTAEIIK